MRNTLDLASLHHYHPGIPSAGGDTAERVHTVNALENILSTGAITDKTSVGEGINDGFASYRCNVGGTPAIAKITSATSDPRREVAAYVLSTMFPGLVHVPTTILRDVDGTSTSLQAWLPDVTFSRGWHTITRSDIVGLASFDYIISNGDRHLHNYVQSGSTLYAIDHGLAFETFDVRRNSPSERVAGTRIPAYIVSHMRDRLLSRPNVAVERLSPYLSARRISDVLTRAESLASMGRFPANAWWRR